MIQSLKTGKRTTVVPAGRDGRYLDTGHLVYMAEGTMMAVRFDLNKMEVTSGRVPVVEGIHSAGPEVGNATQYAMSSTGVLVYVPGSSGVRRDDVFLYDRKGGMTALKLPPGLYGYPRVSPDGKRIALETRDDKQTAISVYDLSGTNSLRRLTFGGNNRLPIWSADGKRLAFQSDRDGDRAIFWQSVDGGTAERLTRPEPGTSHVPESWAPRADLFLFSVTRESASTLWTFSVRDRKASRFSDVASPAFPTNAVFSPDGRWVAYQRRGTGARPRRISSPFRPPAPSINRPGRAADVITGRQGAVLCPGAEAGSWLSRCARNRRSGSRPRQPVPRRFGLAPPEPATLRHPARRPRCRGQRGQRGWRADFSTPTNRAELARRVEAARAHALTSTRENG